MDATIVIDETVSRELTKHNMVAKRAGFNQQRKIHCLQRRYVMYLRYACTWACSTSSDIQQPYKLSLFLDCPNMETQFDGCKIQQISENMSLAY